ncbi:MAG: AraC family transcriptional regulator [Polyangiaceae bacterium]
MLYASSHSAFGEQYLRTHLVIGRSFRMFASERERLPSDTKFFPTSQKDARRVSQLWFLLEGEVLVTSPELSIPFVGPCLVSLPEHFCKGALGHRPVYLRTEGERIKAIHIHYRGPLVDFGAMPLSGDVLAAASNYHHAVLRAPTLDVAEPEQAFLGALANAKLVPPDVAEETHAQVDEEHVMRVWRVMREMYAALDANPSIKIIATKAGFSRRHTARLIDELLRDYLFPPGGFQEMMLTLRLSLASMLLRGRALSVAEVARRVGYAYPESLANAFKRAGIEPPMRVKSEPAQAESVERAYGDASLLPPASSTGGFGASVDQ